MIDLDQLPDIDFVNEDVQHVTNNLITVVEALVERKLYPGDPLRLFLLSIAKIVVQQRVLINHVKRMDHLRYAKGVYLDYLGVASGTERLHAAFARATVRCSLSAPRPAAIAIPVGTRITANGSQLMFVTTDYAEISAGAVTVDVPIECVQPGMIGNDFLVGQLDTLVDPIPFVASVRNTTISSGGSEQESDEAYRERIRLAPEGFSTAGSEGAYKYWAKTASPAIIDVTVSSPSDAVAQIVPLLSGGEIPTQSILDAVADVLSDRTKRPLTDRVVVAAPTKKDYAIDLTYWIGNKDSADITSIQRAVASAVDGYILWQKSKLGRDINPSELIRKVMLAGASRVHVTSPVFAEVDDHEVAVASSTTVTYGGMSDD